MPVHHPASPAPEGTIEDVLEFLNAFDPSSVEDGRLVTRVPSTPTPTPVTTSPSSASPSDDSGSSYGGDSEESVLLAHSEQLLGVIDSPSGRLSIQPHSGSQSSTSSTPTWSASMVQQKPAGGGTHGSTKPRRRNTAREKMRYEIDYLRTRASELEAKLAALEAGGDSSTLTLGKSTSPPSPAFSAVWTRIARNQLELRQRSEAENRRLRREVQLCFEISRSISDALNKRQSFSSALESKYALKRRRKIDGEYAARFADLVADLDGNYARTDAVLREAGIATAHSERARAPQLAPQLSPSGELLRSVELAAISSFPFHAQMAGNALWRAIAHWNTTRSASWLHQDESLFMAHGLAEYSVPDGSTVTYPFTTAMKKYADPKNSRWVIVWRSYTELNGDAANYYADESGWVVVEPLVGPTASANRNADDVAALGSLCRSCVQFVHREKETTAVLDADSSAAQELTNVASMIGTQDAALISKMMESLLLDEVNAATNNVGNSSDAQARGRR